MLNTIQYVSLGMHNNGTNKKGTLKRDDERNYKYNCRSVLVIPFLVIPLMRCLNDCSIPFLSMSLFENKSCFRVNFLSFSKKLRFFNVES